MVEPLRDRPADLLFNLVIFRCYLNWHASMSLLGLQRCEGFDCAVFDAKLREVGTALEFCLRQGLETAFLCDGQDVHKSIHRATPARFADLCLRGRIS